MICLNSAGNLVRSEVGNERWESFSFFLSLAALRGEGMLQKSIPSHVPPQPRPRGRAEGDTVRKKRSPQKKEVSLPALRQRPSLHLKPRSRAPPKKRRPDCESSGRQINEPPAMGRTSPTLRRAWPKDGPLAAICVQSVDVQCVLQFTLIHAAGCVLHRRTSRVIHRLKLFLFFFVSKRSRVLLRPRKRHARRAGRVQSKNWQK